MTRQFGTMVDARAYSGNLNDVLRDVLHDALGPSARDRLRRMLTREALPHIAAVGMPGFKERAAADGELCRLLDVLD